MIDLTPKQLAARDVAHAGAARKRDRDAALGRADAGMVAAKKAFSIACLATLRGAPDAVVRTREALDAVDQARAALRAISDQNSASGE